jgi:arylsulfatase A-like enzyme
MDTTPPETAARRSPSRIVLSPTGAILLAISFGLCAGYLDLGFILFKRLCWNAEGYFRTARDFPWTVPIGHAVLLLIPGVVVASVNRIRPGLVSLPAGASLFAAIAIWGALLRMPFYGACSLVLAAGLGRLIGGAVGSRLLCTRPARYGLAVLVGLLGILAAVSSGRQAVGEHRAVAALPSPPASARNVVLIVWDTVRAFNLSLYGYARDTTPNLVRWARQGVTYNRAVSPAPWTFPAHASFFTGQWPIRLNSQWKFKLDAPYPTLAEYLASRGYQTAGFAANTNCCSYETGLSRGFAHFEDYALTPRSLLARTIPGNWILTNILSRSDFYDKKWIGLQSRGAREINADFLNWLNRRRSDRPFFAYLNYFDAHEPYVPPAGHEGHFGTGPKTREDFQYLLDYVGAPKGVSHEQSILMARDCYDDCIAFLDEQLGRLLQELQSQGLLDNTEVIITADHGEGFGDHGFYGHNYSVNLDEINVPLVILSPGSPAGKLVNSPVSLRDLPATVVDRLDLSAGSPFPGRSLAVHWGLPPGQPSPEMTTPAFSERAVATAIEARRRFIGGSPTFEMSLVARDHHYVRNAIGGEELYNLTRDPYGQFNLLKSTADHLGVNVFRMMLFKVLTENPGSIEVEAAYLRRFRQELKAVISESYPPRVAVAP